MGATGVSNACLALLPIVDKQLQISPAGRTVTLASAQIDLAAQVGRMIKWLVKQKRN